MQLTPRKLAELIESQSQNKYRVDTSLRIISSSNYKNGKYLEAFVPALNTYVKHKSDGPIKYSFKTYEFSKENVLEVIQDILLNGRERRVLNSVNPGKDNKSCKNKREIYSLAFIKRNFFGIHIDDSYNNKKFKDMLVKLSTEGHINLIRNRANSVIGLELINRKVSAAEEFVTKLIENDKTYSGMSCDVRRIRKFGTKKWNDKSGDFSSKYNVSIIPDAKDDEKFFLNIEPININIRDIKNFINAFDEVIEEYKFYKIYESKTIDLAKDVIENINSAIGYNLKLIPGLKILEDKYFGFWVNY